MSRITRGGVIAAAVCLSLAAPGASAQTRADSLALDTLRAALQKYQDPYVAVNDGYFSTVGCVDIERPGAPGHVAYQPGGMGIHFLNMSVVGPVPDPAHPPVLIYEPDGRRVVHPARHRRKGAAAASPHAVRRPDGRPYAVDADGPPPLGPACVALQAESAWDVQRHESEREVRRLLLPTRRRGAEARARTTAMTARLTGS